MRALWLEDGSLSLRTDIPTPVPQPGEALIRVLCAGICNTDLELLRGYAGFKGIPGHEFVGRVEQAAGHRAWVGRRVVGEINAVCGDCATCRAGRPSHCEQRTVLGIVNRHGALAELLTLPVANLHELPDAVEDEAGTFVEPTAAAFEILDQLDIGSRDQVAVVGDGKLGLLVAQVLATTGCCLVVVGRHPAKLAHLGTRGIDASCGIAGLRPRSLDVVVECSGHPSGLADALRLVRPRGMLVLKSTFAGPTSLDLAPIVVDEITVMGSRCGPFAPAIDAIERGTVNPRPLIDAEYPLARGLEAFDHARRKGALKIIVRPGAE